MNTTGYKEYDSDNDPMICNKCGHNLWREDNTGDLFCVPCHYALPISKSKAIELNNLLRRGI